jgi:processive 1,2-diacylglycerol beta-glucosyltransferase
MTETTLLLLSVSAGAGHTRAAEALRRCARATDPALHAIHLDVMQFVTPSLRRLYTDFYLFLVQRAPSLWRGVYHLTNDARPDSRTHRLRRWAERRGSAALLRKITECAPDLIICTHFLPAELLSQLRASGAVRCPVWVQITDFDVHQMWVHEHMAGYFVPNDEVAFRLRARGIAPDAIHVTGIPIMAGFSRPPERAVCARALGIDPAQTTLLLMGGGAGLGALDAVAAHLLAAQDRFQLLVLAGRNEAMLAALQALAARYPGRLVAHGHTDQVEQLMACADLVITKPGGLTCSECLAMGLPMILNAPIPGQEEQNANYLLEQGVALKAFDLVTLEYRVRHLLAHPDELEAMRRKAKALGRPQAARQVLDTVLLHATESEPCRLPNC